MLDPKNRRVRGGIRAKAFGKGFESIFEKMCRLQHIVLTRIPDGCKQVSAQRLIRVKTPFDYVLSYGLKTALIDTKTVDQNVFTHSRITDHQVDEMAAHQRIGGGPAGYVIWLRPVNTVFFIDAITLCQLRDLPSGSFCHTHAQSIILGDSFTFDIKKIFQAVSGNGIDNLCISN